MSLAATTSYSPLQWHACLLQYPLQLPSGGHLHHIIAAAHKTAGYEAAWGGAGARHLSQHGHDEVFNGQQVHLGCWQRMAVAAVKQGQEWVQARGGCVWVG